MKKIKDEIKKQINEPPKEIKVFIVGFKISEKSSIPLRINCSQFTITPKLSLVFRSDDIAQSITYSKDELKKKKFRLYDIKKIINAIKNDTISFATSSVSISDILNA